MKTEKEIIDILYNQYQIQGYITEQAIFDLCDDNSLSFLATDRVCSRLIDLGVLIYNNQNIIKTDEVDDVYKDYSQIDYNIVYEYYKYNYPQMNPIISYIKSLSPPQKGENNNLVIQLRSGNRYARKQIIEKNMRTALRIAMNYADKTNIPIDELFSVACEGLITAVDSFDPYSNSYFASYASFWMFQKIDRYILDNQYLIRIPVHSYEMLNKVKDISEKNNSEINLKLVRNIAEELEISYSDAVGWARVLLLLEPIDIDEIYDDSVYVNYDTDDYLEIISNRNIQEQFKKIFEKLTPREKKVVDLRYGFDGNKCHTLEEIGIRFKVSRERIRQIEAKALRKLKYHVNISHMLKQ